MYDRSQVQNRVWQNAPIKEDYRDGPFYICKCGKKYSQKVAFIKHMLACNNSDNIEMLSSLDNYVLENYVVCGICGFVGKNIARHIVTHSITLEDYHKKYGGTLHSSSREAYSIQNKYNGAWVDRARDAGEDLSDYFKRIGEGVSRSIMSNEEERKRRAKLLGDLNKTEAFRRRSSEVAKVTSSRSDVIERRANVLRDWRKKNPEEFYEKCTKPMLEAKVAASNKTKPEKILLESLARFGFESGKKIYSEKYFYMNKTLSKEVDLYSEDARVVIEFDGPAHFKNVYGDEALNSTIERDAALDEYCISEELILIRVDYSQFLWRRGDRSRFKDGVLERIVSIIGDGVSGVYRIGEYYAED